MSTTFAHHPLQTDPTVMRQVGYQIVDWIVTHRTTLANQPPVRVADPAYLAERLPADFPSEGRPLSAVLATLREAVFDHQMHTDHPRFHAFVPSASLYLSALADALAAGHNTFCGHWLGGSGPAHLERVTVDWLRRQMGLPAEGGGLFLSGGSAANQAALVVARVDRLGDDWRRGTVYYSNQTHASVGKALRTLGFAPAQLRPQPVGPDRRVNLRHLADQLAADRTAGWRPFCLIGNAGTTNTGTVDDLIGLRRLANQYGCWLHVDGAYGAAAFLTARGQQQLAGLGAADSLTLDPHKWWFQPYEMGCLLTRDASTLRQAFDVRAEYLRPTEESATQATNYYAYGPQLTRGFRALKLWLSLQVFGTDAFAEAVDHGLDLAEHLEAQLHAAPAWEVITQAQLGVVTFRYRSALPAPAADLLHVRVAQRTLAGGQATVLTTEIDGRTVLRMCTIHPATEIADLDRTLSVLTQLAQQETHKLTTTDATDIQ